ncbi:MAG: putative transrane anti-sigma factor [Chthonomonadaceae bacterium]|nr:putative transrane anti-sigma factor [Chthonomonadaceae bacterium]
MTECEKLRNDLKAFLDGQLSPATRIAMRLHLNRCASCRKELEEMRLLGTNMRAADTLEMSDALRSRILASVPTTAPEAKVKMLPKWREKPVLIWGASASAALAWFILYPAINNYQDHAPRSATATSNVRQIGMGAQLYTQDYDEANKGGKAPGDTAIISQSLGHSKLEVMQGDRLLADAYKDGKVPGSASLNVHQVNGTDVAGLVNGTADGYQVTHGRMRIGGDVSGGEGHGVLRYTFPRTFDLQHGGVSDGHVQYGAPLRYNGNVPIQVAQNAKNDQSQSGKAATPQDTFHIGQGYALDDLPTERQVHKEASLTVEVANAEQQSESVERLVKESKGYVAQNQLTTVEDGTRQASLTCKVPVDQFDTVMGQVARLGLLKGKTLSGEDITEKVSDEQETGHVLRADIVTTEEKLKTRKRHSETVRDEETLRQLRIRVAQSQARLKMLTRLGALSEITVELAEKPKNAVPEQTKPASPFMEEVSGTGQAAAHSFLMALRLPVQLLVWIVVYSPLWALLIFGYRRMTR